MPPTAPSMALTKAPPIECCRVLLMLSFFVGVLLFALPVSAQPTQPDTSKDQKIVRICASESGLFHIMFIDSIRRAYERIGYQAEFVMLPDLRSLRMANEGICQAEIIRIAKAEKGFPNLKRVPFSIAKLEGFAFTINTTKTINTWDDLKGLNTYIVNGDLYAMEGTKGMDVGKAKSLPQIFRMLVDGKIDIAIGMRETGEIAAKRDFPGSGIHTIGAPLASFPMYHMVHRDSQHLIPLLNDAFQEMVANGEIETLNARAMQRLIDQP